MGFIFSNLNFSLAYPLPITEWFIQQHNEAYLMMGTGIGVARSQPTDFRATDPESWERYDPFESTFAFGGSSPIR